MFQHNDLFQYAFDSTTGRLTALTKAKASVPQRIGPRHVAFHPKKPFVLFSNEQELGVTLFRIGPQGNLSLAQVCSAGNQKATAGVAASDIAITRDGRFVYVGVRDFGQGKVDAIHRYGIQDSGRLTHLGKTAADKIPWGLELSPSGRFLMVTATHGETLTAYEIQSDGNLMKKNVVTWGKMVRDIGVVLLE